ncbi:MAG: PQQ-binding-like beta-propeller repeat protein [Candidatus Thermoplasmatota archaeon]
MRNKIIILLVSICCISSTVLGAGLLQQESNDKRQTSLSDWWPMFGHDAANTRLSQTSDFTAENARVIWNYPIGIMVGSSPVVTDDKVYIGVQGTGQTLICIDALTGNLLWQNTTYQTVYMTPTIADNKVYVGSYDKKIYCFDATTGQRLWVSSMMGDVPYGHSPKIYNNNLLVGSKDKKLWCFNINTGATLWTSPPLDGWVGTTGLYNGYVYFGTYSSSGAAGGTVYCFDADPSDGIDEGIDDPTSATYDLVWSYQTENIKITSSPAISNDRVYIASQDSKIYCFDATPDDNNDGIIDALDIDEGINDPDPIPSTKYDMIWSYTTGGAIVSSPALFTNQVFIPANDKKLYCLNAETGILIWEKTLPVTAPLVQGCPSIFQTGKIILPLGAEKKLICLDANNYGQELWNYSFNYTSMSQSPAIGTDGTIYLGFHTLLLAFGPNKKPQTPQQPSGPTTGIVGASYQFSTVATDPDGDMIRYAWDWGDGTPLQWTAYYASGTPVELSHTYETVGTYQIKVKAQDINTGESDFSDPLEIIISNTPPTQPVVTGPQEGLPQTTYTFIVSATDEDTHQIRFICDWGDGSPFILTEYVDPGTLVKITHAWQQKGTYNIRVKANDSYGAESPWSDIKPITIKAPAELSITNIHGGGFFGQGFLTMFGLKKIFADLSNTGETAAYNITWKIILSGSATILKGQTQTGTLPLLGPGEESTLLNDPIVGFGSINITITAQAENTDETRIKTTGYLLGPLIYVKELP